MMVLHVGFVMMIKIQDLKILLKNTINIKASFTHWVNKLINDFKISFNLNNNFNYKKSTPNIIIIMTYL